LVFTHDIFVIIITFTVAAVVIKHRVTMSQRVLQRVLQGTLEKVMTRLHL